MLAPLDHPPGEPDGNDQVSGVVPRALGGIVAPDFQRAARNRRSLGRQLIDRTENHLMLVKAEKKVGTGGFVAYGFKRLPPQVRVVRK